MTGSYVRLLFVTVLWASLEEVVFRYYFFVSILDKYGYNTETVWFKGLAACALFGLGHGGVDMILSHGTAGVFFSLLFLKVGGWQGSPFKAFVLVSCVHAFCNLVGAVRLRIEVKKQALLQEAV